MLRRYACALDIDVTSVSDRGDISVCSKTIKFGKIIMEFYEVDLFGVMASDKK